MIVSYNSGGALLECLDSLHTVDATGANPIAARSRIVLVDNASSDGAFDAALRRFPGVVGIRNGGNLGFARGCNVGIAGATEEFVLFLNPDAVAPPGAIEALTDWLRANPQVAACGPRIVGSDGVEQPSGQRFPTLGSELSRQWEGLARLLRCFVANARMPASTGPVDWISGACFLARAAALRRHGGFDGSYFLYFEETDWCQRVRRAGAEIHLLPHVVVRHAGGVSARNSGRRMRHGQVATWFARSRRRYFRRWHGLPVAIAVDVLHGVRRLAEQLRIVGEAR